MTTPEADRKIVVVTADAVEDTGIISFKFMVDADLREHVDNYPSAFAWVWREFKDKKPVITINVFSKGSMVMGGPLYEDGSPADFLQDCWDSIPSCTMLMTQDMFKWFKEVAPNHGMKFKHHHHKGFLKTS